MERASFSIFFFFFLVTSSSILMLVAASTEDEIAPSPARVEVAPNDIYIISVIDGPRNGKDFETFSINILVSVLGSVEAAKKALVYPYEYAFTGFSARLNPKQAHDIARVPGVLQVIPDSILHIDLYVKKLFQQEQLKPHLHAKRQ